MTVKYDTYRKLELETFEKKINPTTALWALGDVKMRSGLTVRIQKRILKNIPAVDVALGTGGRYTTSDKYDYVDFTVPEYNQMEKITEEDVFKVHFGETEYSQAANIIELVTDKQATLQDTIILAQELQARDALFFGKITLTSGNVIDYNLKDTHKITVENKWNAANGTPLTDLSDAADVIINDSRLTSPIFHLYMEEKGMNALLSNPEFKSNADYDAGYKRTQVAMPLEKTPGVTYHGTFAKGSKIFHLWGYKATYTVPEGYNYADEGKQKTYIPTGQALLFNEGTKFQANYGAINDTNNQKTDVPTGRLNLKKVKYLPYSYGVTQHGSSWTDVGVKSRPLFVPIDVDGYAVLKGLT